MILKLILITFVIVSLINTYLDLKTMHVSILLNYTRILLNSDSAKVTPKDTSPYGMEINHLRNAGYEFIETVEKGIECWEATK